MKAERKMENARRYANRILGFAFCLYLIIIIVQFGCSTNIKEFYWAALWKYEQLQEQEPNCFFMNNVLRGASHGSDIVNQKYDEIHRPYIELYGICQKVLGKDSLIADYLVNLNNNQLTFLIPRIPDDDIDFYVQKTQCLYSELQEKNIPFCFVMFPYKVHKEVTNLPRGIKDYSNDNADRFLQSLEKKNIPFIDTRQLYINDPDKHYQLFYSGDHHWTPEYAYETYWYISKILSKQNSPCSQYFSCNGMGLKDMKKLNCSNPFSIPSQEKLVGTSYLNKPEKTTFIIPKAHTDFTFKCPLLNLEKTGDIQNTFLFYYNNKPVIQITNNLVHNNNKILLISDSYSRSFIPFITLNNYQVDYIVPWEYNDDIYDYIEATQPDIVIFAINPLCIRDTVFRIF